MGVPGTTAAGGPGAGGRSWYHDDFYTDPTIIGWYKEWIAHVLERTNTLTGVRYKDDPTIAMWELGNEPRLVDPERFSEHGVQITG